MIEEKKNSANNGNEEDDDYVHFEEMDRESPIPEKTRPEVTDPDEEPVLSTVFAVEQLKRGAETAASFFSWGLEAFKSKVEEIGENDQVKQMVDSAKYHTRTLSSNASDLWESTRNQRTEIASSAAAHLERIKTESARAFDTVSVSLSNVASGTQDQRDNRE